MVFTGFILLHYSTMSVTESGSDTVHLSILSLLPMKPLMCRRRFFRIDLLSHWLPDSVTQVLCLSFEQYQVEQHLFCMTKVEWFTIIFMLYRDFYSAVSSDSQETA